MSKRKVSKNRHHPFLTFFLVFAVFLVVVRLALPVLITTVANSRLEKESPYFSFHIDNVDLEIIKGVYSVGGISGKIKSSGEQFLAINSVVTEVSWKNIFNGLIVSDVAVNNIDLKASQSLLDNAKLEGQRIKDKYASKEEDKNKEPILRVNSLVLRNSNITIHDFLSFKGREVRSVSDINVLATNVIPTKARPETEFMVTANIFGPAPLSTMGVANLKNSPPIIDLNMELKNFELKTINPLLREKVQALIHKGNMDLYSEVKMESNEVKGYIKPFVSKLLMDTPKGGFNFTGAAAKTGGNLVKILLTGSESKTLATEVPFTFDVESKKMTYEILPVLQKAIVYKAKQNIQPGISDNVGQKGLGVQEGLIQAQEAR